MSEKSAAFPFLPAPKNLDGYARNLGFDPLGISDYFPAKSDAQVADMKLKEVTHCRLAMLAFSGVVTQSVLYDKGFPYF